MPINLKKDRMTEKASHRKFRLTLLWRFVIVGQMVYVALFFVVLYAVSRYSGMMWGYSIPQVTPELIERLRSNSLILVAWLFLIVYPFWMGSSYLFSRQLTNRFRELTQTADEMEQIQRPKSLALHDLDEEVVNSTDEIGQVKNMLTSMMSKIRESDELFRSIVSNQRELINRWKPNMQFTFVNQAFCEFFGYPEEHWLETEPAELAEGLQEIYPDLYQMIYEDVLVRLTPTNPEMRTESYLTMPDGETHWVQWHVLALFDDDGDITECQSIGYVLTDLKRTQLELENANLQLGRLSQELIQSQESERVNLARFLHDEILGELGQIVRNPGEHSVDIAAIQDIIDHLRSRIYLMRSPMLEYGLPMALEDLVDTMRERMDPDSGLELLYEVDSNQERFSPEVETHVFRIIQEASKNAVEHSGGSQVKIVGKISEGLIDLMVEDNGSGFERYVLDAGMLALTKHYGLIGMEERCNIIGAKLEIHSGLKAGTRVRVFWQEGELTQPVTPPEQAQRLFENPNPYKSPRR